MKPKTAWYREDSQKSEEKPPFPEENTFKKAQILFITEHALSYSENNGTVATIDFDSGKVGLHADVK